MAVMVLRQPRPVSLSRGFARLGGSLFVCLLIAAAYADSLPAGFILDDPSCIVTNQSIRSLWPLGPVLIYEHQEGRTVDGRPLLNLSLAVNRALTGTQPWGFRAGNILLHCFNAVLLLVLARLLLSSTQLPMVIQQQRDGIAFIGTLLWAVHPLCTGAVTYIIQRAESLATCLMLITTLLCLRGLSKQASRADDSVASAAPQPFWLLLVALFSALAGTAKETAVTIPLVTMLIDRALFAGSWQRTRSHWRWHLAAAASWPVVLAMLWLLGGRGSSAGFGAAVSPWLYLLTQAEAIWIYLLRIVWPATLVFDYGEGLSGGLWESWPWLLATTLLVAGVCAGYARRPVVFLAPLLFFVLLGPTSSIIPVKTQTVAEHRLYLPSATLIYWLVALSALILELIPRRHSAWRLAWFTSWLVVAAALSARTVSRNADYTMPERLWAESLAAVPTNTRAMINLAGILIDQKVYDEAADLLNRAAQTSHRELPRLLNEVRIDLAFNRWQRALDGCSRCLEMSPDNAEILTRRAFIYWKLGNLDAAEADLDRAAAFDPETAGLWSQRANLLFDRGDLAGSIAASERAIIAEPNRWSAWSDYGQTLSAAGRTAEALQMFQEAIRLAPTSVDPWLACGNTLASTGRLAEAIDCYSAVLQHHPNNLSALHNRCLTLQQLGRVADARADATRLRALGQQPPSVRQQPSN